MTNRFVSTLRLKDGCRLLICQDTCRFEFMNTTHLVRKSILCQFRKIFNEFQFQNDSTKAFSTRCPHIFSTFAKFAVALNVPTVRFTMPLSNQQFRSQ